MTELRGNKASFVRHKFSNIARRYDSLNSLLSFGLDRYWRWRTVRELRGATSGRLLPLCGNAEELPFADNSFAGVTVGFGVRNLSDPRRGIGEICRVLRPGGRLVILEFSRPDNPFFKPLYGFYKNLLPLIAGVLSGDQEAYSYLASSIEGFLPQRKLLQMLEECGFHQVKAQSLSLGIVTVYTGVAVA